MTISEIAAEIARNPTVDRSFKRDSHQVVTWRKPREYAEYRSLMVDGDFWHPYLDELTTDDWEFIS